MPSTPGQEVKGDRGSVEIIALAGLQYDTTRFFAMPGQVVTLKFVNNDDMAHNLVFTRPGQRLAIVNAAIALGNDGPKQNWVPRQEAVLWHTPVLPPGGRYDLKFNAPNEAGLYPYVCTFPGHGLVMYGVMYVGLEMPDLVRDPNIPPLARQGKNARRQFHAWGHRRPLVYRVFMPDASPAAIAVALPHGQNYCWDAGQCRIRYAWFGGFVDPWPVWQGNGDGLAKVLGTRYWEAKTAIPIRFGQAETRVKFQGYRKIKGHPEFHFQVNGVDVYELIQPLHSGLGITRSIRVPNNDQPATLALDPAQGVEISHSAGQLKDGVLRLTADQAREFTVTLTHIPAR